MQLVDTTIYLDGTIRPEERETVIRQLRHTPGVIAPRFTPGRNDMLQVAYNPEHMGADTLLTELREQGIEGRIVAF